MALQRSFQWFENNVIYRVPEKYPGAGRRVYPGFLQYTGFVAMNPDRHVTSHYDYFKDLVKGDGASAEAHRKFYDEYNAVLDMDAHYYLETIQTVFQEFKLVHGTWDVRNPEGVPERVQPQDIRETALLTIEGELDDISGSGQTRAAHELCSGIVDKERRHIEVQGAGHYGIFSGSRWRETVYPQVREFILHNNRATQPAAAQKAVAAVAPTTVAEVVPAAPVVPTVPEVPEVPAPTKAEAVTEVVVAEVVAPAPTAVAAQPGPQNAEPPLAAAAVTAAPQEHSRRQRRSGGRRA